MGCEAVGFPLWQIDPKGSKRDAAELHGTIRVTEGEESGLLGDAGRAIGRRHRFGQP